MRLLLLITAFMGMVPFLTPTAEAQIRVALEFQRKLFIPYEPILAKVSIENLSGRELTLQDQENTNWFSFQIETAEGRAIAPRSASYTLDPVQIGAGQKIERLLNLTPLYPLDEYGSYSVRAVVHAPDFHSYFSSSIHKIDITEGRKIWQQRVGVPMTEADGGDLRTLTLLTHRHMKKNSLYLRIEDEEKGLIYATHRLGPMVSYSDPSVELSPENSIHVLHNIKPTVWMHSHIGLKGEVLIRDQFLETRGKPFLRPQDGSVAVVGGVKFDPEQLAQQEQQRKEQTPSISDRPVPLPDALGGQSNP